MAQDPNVPRLDPLGQQLPQNLVYPPVNDIREPAASGTEGPHLAEGPHPVEPTEPDAPHPAAANPLPARGWHTGERKNLWVVMYGAMDIPLVVCDTYREANLIARFLNQIPGFDATDLHRTVWL